jgi:Predicted membrane protein
MSILILLAAAILPAIILGYYILKQDPQPEPTSLLVKAALYGVGIIIPIFIVETIIQLCLFGSDGPISLLGTTIEAFIVAALPEEGFKLLALWLVLRKNPFFDEHFDGIVYAVCIGLGFATIENVGFIFQEGNGLSVAISRALFAVPGHYAFAVIMGYYYSLYHFVDRSPRTAIYILLIPVVAHGIYDAIVLGGNVNPYIGCVSTFVLICFCIKMHKFAKEKMFAQIDRDKKCYNT